MRHAHASRHALPILLSCLALAACERDVTWPAADVVTQRQAEDCHALEAAPDDRLCSLAWTLGYTSVRDETSTDTSGWSVMQLRAYDAGVQYARSIHGG